MGCSRRDGERLQGCCGVPMGVAYFCTQGCSGSISSLSLTDAEGSPPARAHPPQDMWKLLGLQQRSPKGHSHSNLQGHSFDVPAATRRSSVEIHPHPSGRASKEAGLAEQPIKAGIRQAASAGWSRVASEPWGRVAEFPDPHQHPLWGSEKEKPFRNIGTKEKSHSSFSLCLFSALG